MKYLILISSMVLCLCQMIAQDHLPNDPMRMQADEELAPFYHGVASGDPLSNAVIIWTRVSDTTGTVDVNWRVATDPGFNHVVKEGSTWTGNSKDFTVKVDVTDLQPYTYYFYNFEVGGKHSLTGRTKTAPVGDNDHFRAAVVSCANYEAGYFHAYNAITERNDVDLVIHLGDYIYEYGVGEFPLSISGIRLHDPEHETLVLSDYRMRHSQYKLDPDLLRLHQHYPMITVWDDHETANNSYRDGAQNHQADTEGPWATRKEAGTRAYHEWMPIRTPDEVDLFKIYRGFSYGNLVDIFMLDTRLYDRDQQSSEDAADPERTILGPEQLSWLQNSLSSSTSTYKIMGNQVMFAPLLLLGSPLNNDQWDGYQAEQTELRNFLLDNSIDNVAFVTGDIHTSWANDIPSAEYVDSTGAGSAAVEFVVTSVTSPGLDNINLSPSFIQGISPHTKYVNLDTRGFVILDITEERMQGDWYHLTDVAEEEYEVNFATGWYSNNGDNHLTNSGGNPSQPSPEMIFTRPPATPFIPDLSGLDHPSFALLGLYPNPAAKYAGYQFFLHESSDCRMSLLDLQGRIIKQKAIGKLQPGLNYQQMELQEIPAGNYIFSLSINGEKVNRQLSISE